MTNFDIPFDNNGSEQDIRNGKIKQKISRCISSEKGAKWYCRIRSYASSAQEVVAKGRITPLVSSSRRRGSISQSTPSFAGVTAGESDLCDTLKGGNNDKGHASYLQDR